MTSCESEVSDGLRAHVAADERVARLHHCEAQAGKFWEVKKTPLAIRRGERSDLGVYSLAPRWGSLKCATLKSLVIFLKSREFPRRFCSSTLIRNSVMRRCNELRDEGVKNSVTRV